MFRNSLWCSAVLAAVCGLVWAAGEPARGGRTVPDAEATQIYGGQTTPFCIPGYTSSPCDKGTNCSTSANTYKLPVEPGTVEASKQTFVYCGTGENCGTRYELSGCNIKKDK